MFPLSLCLLPALLAGRPAQPWVVSQFEACQFKTTAGVLNYRLHLTSDHSPHPRPLVIWLHGWGEAGTDNRSQLAWLELILRPVERAGTAPFYLLAPQRTNESHSWFQLDRRLNDPLDQLESLVQDIGRTYAIDAERIYLVGISQGASGAWSYAQRFPRRFAGVLLLGAPEVVSQVPAELRATPMWVFQSAADGAAKAAHLISLASEFQRVGGRMAVTITPNVTHDCWTYALREADAWQWLLSQRRGRLLNLPPAWPPRRGLRYVGLTGATVVIAAWSIRRLRTAVRQSFRRWGR